MHDFIEEALPANSGVDDAALKELVDRFIAKGMAAQTVSEGLASQTSMSLDAFFAACDASQVLLQILRLLQDPRLFVQRTTAQNFLAFRFFLLLQAYAVGNLASRRSFDFTTLLLL